MKYASFFTGAMGFDLGLEMAGFECVFANEVDPVTCRTIRMNRPTLNLLECDVRSPEVAFALEEVGSSVPIDLVVGGPPCQAFSTAGRRLGLNDERGNVFLHFLDLALRLQPRFIVIENVRGLLSAPLKHRPHLERGFGFEPLSPDELRGGALAHIVATLKAQGYEVSFDLYDTANFGVPQRRERIVLMASKSGRLPHLAPTHSNRGSVPGGLAPWKTFSDAVKGLPPHHEFVPLRDKQLRFVRMLKPGQNWRNLPLPLQREALGRAFECSGGRTGFYRRIAWDQPSPTLLTSPTMPATLLAHPVEDRPLSVQEYARLQAFPDDWRFAGTVAQRYRQIGNAVPVEFGRAVGKHILGVGDGKARARNTSIRGVVKSRYTGTDDLSWAPTSAERR